MLPIIPVSRYRKITRRLHISHCLISHISTSNCSNNVALIPDMRFLAAACSLLSVVALILTFLCLFAGSKQGFLDEFAVLTVRAMSRARPRQISPLKSNVAEHISSWTKSPRHPGLWFKQSSSVFLRRCHKLCPRWNQRLHQLPCERRRPTRLLFHSSPEFL